MASDFLFIDGFDHLSYATNAASSCMSKWTSQSTNASGARATTTGRSGSGAAMRTGGGSSGWHVTRRLLHPSNTYTKLIVGCAFRTTDLSRSIFSLDSGGAGTGVGNTDVIINATGNLELRRNGTIIATTAQIYAINTWYHIELKVEIASGATGSYELRVNGQTVLGPTSSVQTCNVANVNYIRLGSSANTDGTGNAYDWDDLFVQNWATAGVDFIGDVAIVTLRPTAEGNYSDGTPLSGTDNSAMVDETSANDDTDYNTLDAVSERDSFVMSDLPTNGTVHAVQACTRFRKADAGSRTMKQFLRISGSNYEGAAATAFDSYTLAMDIWNSNPAGGAWTDTAVNGMEKGDKVES